MSENATYIAVSNRLAKLIMSGEMKDIYERELGILSDSGVIEELSTRIMKDGETEGWVLYAKIKEKEGESLIITARNTPRRWKKLDTLEAFIRKTCPKAPYLKITFDP